jgi:hypothetical protein
MQHLGLDFNGNVTVIGTLTVAMSRTIKRESAIAPGNRSVQTRPILARSGVTVDQHDRSARALNHEVKVGAVDIDESRLGTRVIMSNTRGDVTLLESASDTQTMTLQDRS